MLTYPTIDPVIFALGPLQVRWYGLMYVLGFLAAYQLVSLQARQFSCERLRQRLDNLNLALIIGVVLGGRLGSLARMRKSALAGGSASSMRTSLIRATGGASARSPVTNCSTAAAGPAR